MFCDDVFGTLRAAFFLNENYKSKLFIYQTQHMGSIFVLLNFIKNQQTIFQSKISKQILPAVDFGKVYKNGENLGTLSQPIISSYSNYLKLKNVASSSLLCLVLSDF